MWEASVFSRERSCCGAAWYRVQLSQPKTEHHVLWGDAPSLQCDERGWLSKIWAHSARMALVSGIRFSGWSGLGVWILVLLLSLGWPESTSLSVTVYGRCWWFKVPHLWNGSHRPLSLLRTVRSKVLATRNFVCVLDTNYGCVILLHPLLSFLEFSAGNAKTHM